MKEPNVMSNGASETCVLPVSSRRTKSFILRVAPVTKFVDKALIFCSAKEFVFESCYKLFLEEIADFGSILSPGAEPLMRVSVMWGCTPHSASCLS